ncbi:MAG: HD family phosphohydrolase [Bacillota bacterium]
MPDPKKAKPLFAEGYSKFSQYWEKFFRNTTIRDWVLVVIIFMILTAILSFDYVPQQLDVKAGEKSKIDYLAPRTIINRLSTDKLIREKEQEASLEASRDPDNYALDPGKSGLSLQRVNYFFERMEAIRKDLEEQRKNGLAVTDKIRLEYARKINDEFSADYNVGFQPSTIVYCLKAGHDEWEDLQAKVKDEIYRILTSRLILEEKIKEARDNLDQWIERGNYSPEQYAPVKDIIARFLVSNGILDMDKVRRLQMEKTRGIGPVYIPAGTPILFKDKIVTEEDIENLKYLNVIGNSTNRILIFFSLSFLILSFIAVLLLYIVEYNKKILGNERLLVLMTVAVSLLMILTKIVTLIPVQYNGWDWRFIIPAAFVSMLLVIFIDAPLALMLTVLLSFMTGVICNGEMIFAIVSLMGGGMACFSLNRFSQRGDLIRAGVLVTVTNMLTIFTLSILLRGNDPLLAVQNSLLGALGGFLSSVLTLGLLPFVEHLFGVTSSMRLLELANPAHPLLRRLLLEAPGTYHHSIIVGNLAESAANAIGADGLLTRIGSYYHDIGKIRRPYFFSENQMGMENPHEKIAPTLSALIITSHVRDGADLARESKLPDHVVEVIEEHHGTDLIRYFYVRAAESEKEDRGEIRQEDFRYPGPKPGSREAALVMLADSVEAAVRAMPKPTTVKIENMINRMIKERLDDNQFSECDLTLKDLHQTSQAFQKILNGIYHTRIQYPEITEIERKKIGNDAHK